MNNLGWVFLSVSWGFIIILAAYCFYRVFSGKKDRTDQTS